MVDINIVFLVSAILLSVALVINLIYLVIKYQKDKMLPIVGISEKELLDKHGAIICSCILQKREFMPRDIIATLVELVQKDEISIEIKKNSENGKIINEYTLRKTGNSELLSDLEQSVIKILFNDSNECILNYEVKKIKRKLETSNLVKRVNKKLEDLGVNAVKVPKKERLRNNVFFVLVCVFFIIHLIATFNGETFFQDFKQNFVRWIIILIKIDALVIFGSMLIKMFTLVVERLSNKEFKRKITLTDDILLNVFAKFVISNFIILILLIFAGDNTAFIADIFLIDIAMVIMVSDEMFISHSSKLVKDYISLKNFEQKLETNEIIEYFHVDKLELLKQYIPFLVASSFKKISMLDYVDKLQKVSMDKNEKEKYLNLEKLLAFEEDSINEYYFSKSFRK